MARDEHARNLRDGQLVINDGSTVPQTLTVVLDNGDLSWTEKKNPKINRDRGALHSHRPGDDEPVQLKFSLMWTQLIGKSVTSGNATEFYEMVNNLDNTFASVAGCGENFSLEYEFTVTAPCLAVSGNSEKITFAEVFLDELQMGEGDDANKIDFSGTDFEPKPTITRV